MSAVQNEKDDVAVADEAAAGPKKHRGLLHVPSRSSSHKVQPSPTSTGLSGATASDPQENTGLRSKGSKRSILGRRRNGSTTSSRMSITPPGAPTADTKNTHTTTPDMAAPRPPKKSFFSILCCGVPENTTDANDPEVLANRVSKSIAARPTTASRPDNAVTGQADGPLRSQTEKDALKHTEADQSQRELSNQDATRPAQGRSTAPAANGDLARSVSLRDQPLPALPQQPGPSSSQVSPPTQVPIRMPSGRTPTKTDLSANRENTQDDANVHNTDQLTNENGPAADVTTRREEIPKSVVLPQPPPLPPTLPTEEPVPETAEGKQQWLLPPIAPRFKGKKCLVLDLDETLVHSSFKVGSLSIEAVS